MTSWETSTTFGIWIRALFYLLVVAGGWLVVLPEINELQTVTKEVIEEARAMLVLGQA